MAPRFRAPRAHPIKRATALLCAVALFALPAPAGAGERLLAAELLIARGDLSRLSSPGLPPAHADGLNARLAGALGLLPWLLTRAGDGKGAAALAALSATDPALAPLLSDLAARHPLDLAARGSDPVPASALREARLIHGEYCAGCHDGAGTGDPELALPARDLALMARKDPPALMLARLINGVRGDETIGFRVPLSDAQLLALLHLYRSAD